jgi:4-amino-4-deoxy-L-arabinose transferase-like glycosyltransferase
MRIPSHIWLPFCLVLAISYLSFFNRLGVEPMHLWDESSYALNAQEMLESGNPIEVKMFRTDDLYNTKPPFAIWAMTISVKFFGFNELGVRMASAVFAFLSCMVLFGLGLKIFKNGWSALALPLVLASSYGFVGEHIARTGDTDCILAFWILLQSVLLLGYTNSTTAKQANMYLILTGIAFSMGCLTKGIAGLTALPGMFAWVLYSRKLKSLFQAPGFYIAIILFIVLVPGYYVLRNHLTPGYWNTMWHFEVGGRLAQQEFLNPEPRPFYYFYKMMVAEDRLFQWIFILPLSVGVIVWSKPSRERTTGLALLFMLVGVSFSLGVSQTKLFWYDAPLYPLIAAVIGISFGLLVHQLGNK